MVLCTSVVANAQNWAVQQGMTVTKPNGSNWFDFQRVESIDDSYLISLSTTSNGESYFTCWEAAGTIFSQSQVFNCGIIYDFAILNDRIYFCGGREEQNDTTGFVGVFQIGDLINAQPITYGFRDIDQTRSLTRIEAYEYTGNTHLVAIGELLTPPFGSNSSCFVTMDDKQTPAFTYDVQTSLMPSPPILFERLTDIVVTENYIATVSFVNPTKMFLVRRYDLDKPEDALLQKSYVYEFPNYLDISLGLSSHLKMSRLDDDFIVVGSSAMASGGPMSGYFIFLNYIDLNGMNIVRNNVIPQNGKMIEVAKLVFSENTGRLLMLGRWGLYGQSALDQSVTHLLPYATTPYPVISEYIYPHYSVCDLNITPSSKYFTAGVNAATNQAQFIHTKDILDSTYVCDKYTNLKVDITFDGVEYSGSNLAPVGIIQNSWHTDAVQVFTDNWIIDCMY